MRLLITTLLEWCALTLYKEDTKSQHLDIIIPRFTFI